MSYLLQPWQLLFVALSGWVNQRQREIIGFQNDEILSLLKAQGGKRISLTDDHRRLLAVKGTALGRSHQGLDNKLIEPTDEVSATAGDVISRERLGGLLKYYHRDPDDVRKAA